MDMLSYSANPGDGIHSGDRVKLNVTSFSLSPLPSAAQERSSHLRQPISGANNGSGILLRDSCARRMNAAQHSLNDAALGWWRTVNIAQQIFLMRADRGKDAKPELCRKVWPNQQTPVFVASQPGASTELASSRATAVLTSICRICRRNVSATFNGMKTSLNVERRVKWHLFCRTQCVSLLQQS